MLPISQRAWALMLAAVCAWWVMLAFGRLSRMASTIRDQTHRARLLTLRLRPLPVIPPGAPI